MKLKDTYISFLLLAVMLMPDLLSGGHFLFYHHQVAHNYFNEARLLQHDMARHCPYLEHKFYPVSSIQPLNFPGYLASFYFNLISAKNAIPELSNKYSYLLRGPPKNKTISQRFFLKNQVT